MSKTAKKTDPVMTERMYQVIKAPVITEKAALGSEHGQVTFRVAMDATKPEIKRAVEGLFKVEVTKVNTIVTKGKEKRFRGHLGQRSNTKKAIVTLAEGQTIDITSGV